MKRCDRAVLTLLTCGIVVDVAGCERESAPPGPPSTPAFSPTTSGGAVPADAVKQPATTAAPAPLSGPSTAPAAEGLLVIEVEDASSPGGWPVYRLDGDEIKPPDLRAALRRRGTPEGGTASFVLRADDATTYADLQAVLIELAMARHNAGRLESRSGEGYPFTMPIKMLGSIPDPAALVEIVLDESKGTTTVTARDVSETDLGEPLARRLSAVRAEASPDAIAALTPTKAVRYRDVLRVYGACLRAGFRHVVFRTHE